MRDKLLHAAAAAGLAGLGFAIGDFSDYLDTLGAVGVWVAAGLTLVRGWVDEEARKLEEEDK